MGQKIAMRPMLFASFAFHVGCLPGCDRGQLQQTLECFQYQNLDPCPQIWDSHADICL